MYNCSSICTSILEKNDVTLEPLSSFLCLHKPFLSTFRISISSADSFAEKPVYEDQETKRNDYLQYAGWTAWTDPPLEIIINTIRKNESIRRDFSSSFSFPLRWINTIHTSAMFSQLFILPNFLLFFYFPSSRLWSRLDPAQSNKFTSYDQLPSGSISLLYAPLSSSSFVCILVALLPEARFLFPSVK